jgi:3-oxoacyl-[acyl-carrier protein] reductase
VDLGLSGKACVVTGASRGIGLATARRLCAEGASVLLVARDAEALAAGAESCTRAGRDAGARAEWLGLDVLDGDAGERAVRACEERLGPIEALVNNAGELNQRPLEEQTEDEWRGQWELHVMAPLRFMRAAVARMAERRSGRVVNVGSSSGKRLSLTNPAYSVTKAAEMALSRLFAESYAERGVLVNAVAPGPVASPMWVSEGGLADQRAEGTGLSREEAFAEAKAKIPRGRFGTEEEIAEVIVFLCSERAANVAGAAWSVDGGYVPQFL